MIKFLYDIQKQFPVLHVTSIHVEPLVWLFCLVERSLTGCRGINTKVANEEKERYSKEPMRYQSKLKKTTISAGKRE